jgi:hypothetical protein
VDLAVERPAAGHERAEVGDRVGDAVAVAPARDVEGLVEVARARRVDRDERQVDALAGRGLGGLGRPGGGGTLGLGLGRGGEGDRHGGLRADLREPVAQRLGRDDADAAGRHGPRPYGMR